MTNSNRDRKNLYGIVSSGKSQTYTNVAVDSFFKNTVLSNEDRVVVIDNDGIMPVDPRFDLVSRSTPCSFSANANTLIGMADANGQDLVFLSNDIYFPPNWNSDFYSDDEYILIPCCNQTHTYEHNGFKIQPTMNLDQTDFSIVDEIAAYHYTQSTDYLYQTLLMPFYAFILKKSVYKKVGYFDTTFGVAGAEDIDYRIRAAQLNIPTLYTGNSWLLHFQGKSTWDGTETQQQTAARDQIYTTAFAKKWGTDLASLLLAGGNPLQIIQKYNLQSFANSDGWFELLKRITSYANR